MRHNNVYLRIEKFHLGLMSTLRNYHDVIQFCMLFNVIEEMLKAEEKCGKDQDFANPLFSFEEFLKPK